MTPPLWDFLSLRKTTKILHGFPSTVSTDHRFQRKANLKAFYVAKDIAHVHVHVHIQVAISNHVALKFYNSLRQNIMFWVKKDQMSSKVNTNCKSKPESCSLPVTNYKISKITRRLFFASNSRWRNALLVNKISTTADAALVIILVFIPCVHFDTVFHLSADNLFHRTGNLKAFQRTKRQRSFSCSVYESRGIQIL